MVTSLTLDASQLTFVGAILEEGRSIGPTSDQCGGRDEIVLFGVSLMILAIAPGQQDRAENGGDGQGQPSTIGHFGECRCKEQAIQSAEDQEEGQDECKMQLPDYDGGDGDKTGRDEGDKNDAHAVGIAQARGLEEDR